MTLKYSNKNLVDKIKYELVKTSNLLILESINNETNLTKIKKYIEICEKTEIKDFNLYMITINNKCCFLTKNNFYRNAIDMMQGLKWIFIFQKVYSLFILNSNLANYFEKLYSKKDNESNNDNKNDESNNISYNVINSLIKNNISSTKEVANCCLQLCAFNSQIKDHNEALSNGLQALALNQLALVDSIIDKNLNLAELSSNKSEHSSEISVSRNDMELTLSYYNVGVEQEYLKRVRFYYLF